MIMKKMFVLLLASLMLFSAASAEGILTPPEPLAGGWAPSEDPTVTEERMTLFEKGTKTLTGASCVPVAYLGSQVVAGTNHAFLCRVDTAYPGSIDTVPAYAMVYLYEDLSGNVSLLSVAEFDIGSLCTY